MSNLKTRSNYGVHIHRIKTIHTVITAAVVFLTISIFFLLFIGRWNRSGNENKELLAYWEAGSFDKVFNASGTALESKPADYFLLTLRGFSAYQLGIAQINNQDTLTYINECIWSLRKALLLKNGINDGRVYYVLGKAYCYKGNGYADLAIKYLEKARELVYNVSDIPEYLGLAYAAIRDYRGSVEAFTQALDPAGVYRGEDVSGQTAGFSDVLLLSIARSYMALEEFDSAQAYLLRCVEISRDSTTRVAARLLLGELLGKGGDSGGAEAQYMAVLDEAGENAEARYQLGELYAAGGDVTRARAEWRRAVRFDSAHAKARARLGM
jgi:tetratricopeptide (TPR) repeat protein